jgi:acetoin utilization protein AcuB
MNSKSLISTEFPILSLEDTGEKVLKLMNEYHVFHLPLIHRDNYLALISEDDILDWDTPEEPLSLSEFLHFRPSVFENTHPFEAVKLAKQFNLSLVPVVNNQNHFSGIITTENLLNFLSENNCIKKEGGIIILEVEQRNYSLSEIARICESNEIHILGVVNESRHEDGMLQITLKVDTFDIQSVIATFERFNYTVLETYTNDSIKENVQQNYDLLMHYINI